MECEEVEYSVSEKLARYASRKAAKRLIPFLILCFLVNWLDRNNMGFAALTMNKELGFTAEMYGFGAGVFFFGYILFEVPSNPKTNLKQYVIHDLFLGWLYGNRADLKVDIIPGRRKEDTMTLSFSFLKRYIKGCINVDEDNEHVERTVVVEDPDADFGGDILFEEETRPKLTAKGWICKDCEEYEGNKGKELPVFSSLEELLKYHVFDRFLEFVNEKLTKTDALAFMQYGGGTWIKFVEDLSDKEKEFVVKRLKASV